MSKKLIGILLLLLPLFVVAQIPAGYYDGAKCKNGAELKTALHDKIKGHIDRGYDALWTNFQKTDKRADGKVWDMYSNCTFDWGTGSGGDQDTGSGGTSECDKYNREHSWPQSWFDEASPMRNDNFHLYPTDKYVNNQRGNLPYGEVGSGATTYGNGSKMGAAKSGLGYSGNVFEPINEYKGDFARTYFYMVTRYEDKVVGWYSYKEAKPTINGTKYPAFNTWAINMLLRWHRQDPVSQKEINRNNVIYTDIQGNRNPFIDHPELAEYIWGDSITKLWTCGSTLPDDIISVQMDEFLYDDGSFDVSVNVINAKDGVKSVVLYLGTSEGDTTKARYAMSGGTGGVYSTSFTPGFDYTTLYITVKACDNQSGCAQFKRTYTKGDPTLVTSTSSVEFRIYPNPTSTEATLQLPDGILLQKVEVFDVRGALLLVRDGESSTLGTGNLRSGIYIVKITTSKGYGAQLLQVVR